MSWPRLTGRAEPAAWVWIRRLLAAAALVLLCLPVACAAPANPPEPMPTMADPIDWSGPLPTATAVAAAEYETRPEAADGQVVPVAEVAPVARTDASALPPSTVVPHSTPGIRPADAQLLRPAEAPAIFTARDEEDDKIEWRPPPVAVPHSLHPDDHYWLARPLASGSRNYDLEWYPYGNRPTRPEALPYRVHHGMDFPNSTGTPVFAGSSGTVIWAGPLPSNRDGVNYYGNTVVIHHDWQWRGQDVYTLYAHTLELFVEVGDVVRTGQLIAGVGASGEVSGPHLHLEVRVGDNNYNNTRNPALWLAPYEGWGTLAGRFMDSRGRLIHGAYVTVTPVRTDSGYDPSIRRQWTYAPQGINSDDMWQENFVVADLPAGEYQVVLSTAGQIFRRNVTVRPGQTNYIVIQADFRWSPTVTPTPTPTPTATPLPTIAGTPGG